MIAPKLLVYSTGRSGTKTLAATLATLSWNTRVAHEGLGDPILAWQAQYAHGEISHEETVLNLRRLNWPTVAVSYMYTPLLPALREAFPTCRFVWLWRNPEQVAASLIRKGWYLPSDDDLPPVREWDRADKSWWLWPQNWRVRGDLVTCDCRVDDWAAMGQEQRVWWWIGYVDGHGSPEELLRLEDVSWVSAAGLLKSAGVQVDWLPGHRVPWVLDNPESGREDWDGPST